MPLLGFSVESAAMKTGRKMTADNHVTRTYQAATLSM
jgi:hypothetical protein